MDDSFGWLFINTQTHEETITLINKQLFLTYQLVKLLYIYFPVAATRVKIHILYFMFLFMFSLNWAFTQFGIQPSFR